MIKPRWKRISFPSGAGDGMRSQISSLSLGVRSGASALKSRVNTPVNASALKTRENASALKTRVNTIVARAGRMGSPKVNRPGDVGSHDDGSPTSLEQSDRVPSEPLKQDESDKMPRIERRKKSLSTTRDCVVRDHAKENMENRVSPEPLNQDESDKMPRIETRKKSLKVTRDCVVQDHAKKEMEEVEVVVQAMKRKESTSYERRNFLADRSAHNELVANVKWRNKMSKWMYRMVDDSDVSRDMACFGTYYLDMLLEETDCGIVQTFEDLQLATLTCLYLAIKIQSTNFIRMKTMLKFSRGEFTEEEMTKMEINIISALDWRLHPPTARCFQRQLIHILPRILPRLEGLDKKATCLVSQVSLYMIDQCTKKYEFSTYSSASIASAALILAIEKYVAEGNPSAREKECDYFVPLSFHLQRIVHGSNEAPVELCKVYTLMKDVCHDSAIKILIYKLAARKKKPKRKASSSDRSVNSSPRSSSDAIFV